MKKILATAATLCFFAGLQDAAAQDTKARVETTTKQTGPGRNVKTKLEITTGTVKEYEAGRKIKVSGPNDKTYSFDLDENARVEGPITLGQMVTVEWTKDDNGKERVTVLSGPGSSRAAAEVAKQPKPAPGQDLHVKSTTTTHQPGPAAKTKTEMVVGTVREYEPGKKIKVTGPDDDERTFDLDRAVSVRGKVAVGSRVRVEYTKSDDGLERVKVLSLVSSRKTRKAA